MESPNNNNDANEKRGLKGKNSQNEFPTFYRYKTAFRGKASVLKLLAS